MTLRVTRERFTMSGNSVKASECHVVSVVPLEPVHSSRRSFYGRAHVVKFSHGAIGLVSYSTLICVVHPGGGVQYTPKGVLSWSQTTGRHLKEFALQHGFKYGGKRSLETVRTMSDGSEGAYNKILNNWGV